MLKLHCFILTQINKHVVSSCFRAVLGLVWVQAQELGFPRPLLAIRTPTMTMIIMPRIMPTSTTTITIAQMTQTRRMTSGKTCSQESNSLQPTVTQIFCELQIEIIFTLGHVSLTLFCSLLPHFSFHFTHWGALLTKQLMGWMEFACLLACFKVVFMMPLVHRIYWRYLQKGKDSDAMTIRVQWALEAWLNGD